MVLSQLLTNEDMPRTISANAHNQRLGANMMSARPITISTTLVPILRLIFKFKPDISKQSLSC